MNALQASTVGFKFEYGLSATQELEWAVWVFPQNMEYYHATVHQVVIYDNTYNTNRDGYRVGMFTGINRFRQSVVFGYVLMARETVDSFKASFQAWKDIMAVKQDPELILTDADVAELQAVSAIFPNSDHAWCIWCARCLCCFCPLVVRV